MTAATTDHIKALLVDDGRDFAMIRKTDLAALMQIAQTDPHQGRFLDSLGDKNRLIDTLDCALKEAQGEAITYWRSGQKHGEERRRYMANNKALQARVEALESEGSDRYQDYVDACIMYHSAISRERSLESRLLRVARFKRKFPAIGALMDMTP